MVSEGPKNSYLRHNFSIQHNKHAHETLFRGIRMPLNTYISKFKKSLNNFV